MSHCRAGRTLCAASFFLTALLPNLLLAQAPPGYSEVHPIYEGDFDPSRYGLGASSYFVVRGAELALRVDDDQQQEILPQLEAMLKFGEIGHHKSHEAAMLQGRCAVRYIQLRVARAPSTAEWFRQSVAALETFEALLQACESHAVETHLPLVEEIVSQYPESVFVEIALLASCIDRFDQLVKQIGSEPLDFSAMFDPYFDILKRNSRPTERYWHFEHFYHTMAHWKHDPRVLRYNLRFSKNPYLRRQSYAELIRLAAASHDDNLTQLSEAFLAEHCRAHLSHGRQALIRHLLGRLFRPSNQHVLCNAEWWVSQWEQAGHLDDAFNAACAIAGNFGSREQQAECARRYEALLSKAPSEKQLIQLKLRLSRLYQRLDRFEEALPWLKEIAAIPRVEKPTFDNMMADQHQDSACSMLAEHYMRQGQWKTAWTYLQEWNPRSACGVGGRISMRNRMIEECKKHLPNEMTTPSA